MYLKMWVNADYGNVILILALPSRAAKIIKGLSLSASHQRQIDTQILQQQQQNHVRCQILYIENFLNYK